EIEADPGDLREWVDVVILALDGAWRSGATPLQIIEAIVSKQTKNEGRSWPDWRTADPNKAIEHDRSLDFTSPAEAQAVPELTSRVINDACWKFIDAMPHPLPPPIWNNLKGALYPAIVHVLMAQHPTSAPEGDV